VTGADGFIGSHLTESLVRSGYDVRAFVYYNSFNSWGWLDDAPNDVKGKFEVIPGDIRDWDRVNQAMKSCEAVLHLAALISIPYSYLAADSYVETNVLGTLNVLKAAQQNNISRLIHTSTSEVYGSAQYVPITETHPLQAQSPYAASKIGADQLVYSYYSSFDVPAVTLRPFYTYGPRQSARAVIPNIISQVKSGKSTIHLGSIFPTRDFSFIDDTVSGFVSALESDNGLGEVVNLGSNFEISIKETVELIAEIMQVDVEIESDEERVRPENSEVNRLWADNSKAKSLFGWEPVYSQRSGLTKGLAETVQWFSDSNNLSRYKPNLYNL
jgi:dTDP-glucose 4,6-dehydratase